MPPTPRRHRGEGQWALGHREPLNPNERTKKDDDGAERSRAHREHLRASRASTPSTQETCAAGSAGGASTPSARPGIDGGRTALLEPEELDDEFFMLRVRIDGGQLNLAQLRAIADISADSRATPPTSPTGRTSSCTGSGSRTCPEIWRRLGGRRTGHHRGVRRLPAGRSSAPRVAGIAADEIIDPTPAIDEIFTPATSATSSFSNLPRKFKTAISWLADYRRRARDQRRLLRGSRAPRAWARLRPLGRRRPFDQPDAGPAARRLRHARRSARGVGGRRLGSSATTATAGCGNRARIKFLVADWGVEKFRAGAGGRVPRARTLPDGPAPENPAADATTSACTRKSDGRFYVGFAPTVGRVSGTT